uniref:Integrase core domain containing protein n=1 Tax=Solanum tuberosum TaxID=4113 RepID=M1E0L1_SOLTU
MKIRDEKCRSSQRRSQPQTIGLSTGHVWVVVGPSQEVEFQSFFATRNSLVDVESGELKFWVNGEEVIFNIFKLMKQPSDLHVISVIDLIYEAVVSVSNVSCVGESLAVILLNYDGEEIQDYDEVVVSLSGLGSYSKSTLKLDIDLKNRGSLPAKPSIEEPPKLKLKVLPPHLHYVFLEPIILYP